MIKQLFPALALSGLVILSACSKEEIEAKMNDAADAASSTIADLDIDLSNLSADAIKEKAGEVAKSLTSQLGTIKDEASAIDVSKAIEPMVGALDKMKGVLGDKMPDMSSLSGIVEDLKTKFGGDEGIMKVLKPLIEKLQALLQ